MPNETAFPVVVMLRHAQSEWNAEGRFTGWADPALTPLGRAEAASAAARLAARGFRFDQAYSSRLTRARETAVRVLQDSGNGAVPLVEDWRLNERHYGDLQGRIRAQVAERVGAAQVWRWRRGYLDLPPALAAGDSRHPARDPRWADVDPARLPNGESLAGTRERVMDFWRSQIQPRLQAGSRLLIASHGNTLRALLMALDGMSVEQVEGFEIPTGVPIVYAFSPRGEPLGWHYLTGDDTAARDAA